MKELIVYCTQIDKYCFKPSESIIKYILNIITITILYLIVKYKIQLILARKTKIEIIKIVRL